MAINKVILIGNVGKDPEIRTMNNGNEVASFNLATTDTWKDRTGEKRDKTEWHRIVIYSPGLVNMVKTYVKKGTKLYIEGSLQTRRWISNDGTEKYTTEVVIQGLNSALQLLDSRNNGNSAPIDSNTTSSNTESRETIDVDEFIYQKMDDDIPF